METKTKNSHRDVAIFTGGNMKEQEYKIENIKSFQLADIFDCGQCFRWNKQERRWKLHRSIQRECNECTKGR